MTTHVVDFCHSRPIIEEAAHRLEYWPDALCAFASANGLRSAEIETLVPFDAPVDVDAEPIHTTREFHERWCAAGGGPAGALLTAAAGRPIPARFVLPSDPRDASTTPVREFRTTLETGERFFCFHVTSEAAIEIQAWRAAKAHCLEVIGLAATISAAIVTTEERAVLRVLEAAGAVAAIVDGGGTPRRLWEASPMVESVLAAGFTERAPGSDRSSRRGTAVSGRRRFRRFTDAEGGRWIGYDIALPVDGPSFVIGDRLIVAWPLLGASGSPAEVTPVVADAVQDLGEAFGLTAAEATMAVALLSGDVKSAAAAAAVSYETARTHLKSIFRRVGVRRQSELTRILTHFFLHAAIGRRLEAGPAAKAHPIG